MNKKIALIKAYGRNLYPNKFGQFKTITIDIEKKFIAECDKRLPKLTKKELTAEFKQIIKNYTFGESTGRAVCKVHKRNYKPPAKKKTKKNKLRALTFVEKEKIGQLFFTNKYETGKAFYESDELKDLLGLPFPSRRPIDDAVASYKIKQNVDDNKQQKEVFKLYKNGLSVTEISEKMKLKIKEDTIKVWLRRFGISFAKTNFTCFNGWTTM